MDESRRHAIAFLKKEIKDLLGAFFIPLQARHQDGPPVRTEEAPDQSIFLQRANEGSEETRL